MACENTRPRQAGGTDFREAGEAKGSMRTRPCPLCLGKRARRIVSTPLQAAGHVLPRAWPDDDIRTGSRGVQNRLDVGAVRIDPLDIERGWAASVIDTPIGPAIHDSGRDGSRQNGRRRERPRRHGDPRKTLHRGIKALPSACDQPSFARRSGQTWRLYRRSPVGGGTGRQIQLSITYNYRNESPRRPRKTARHPRSTRRTTCGQDRDLG